MPRWSLAARYNRLKAASTLGTIHHALASALLVALGAAMPPQVSAQGFPASGAPPAPLVFAAEVPVAVRISLWPLGLNRGRSEPVFHNFMAQVRFSGEPGVVTCALRMPELEGRLDPGGTAELALRCLQDFRVAPGQAGFRVYAQGKPIGEGRFIAAAGRQIESSGGVVSGD